METAKKVKIKRKSLMVLVIIAITFLVVALIIVLVINKLSDDKASKGINLEGKMETMVSSYYDKNIKGKVIGVHRQVVTLKDLQNQEYDISDFIKSECDLESFSYVILDDPKETDAAKIKYTIEHHLDCK